MGDENSRWDEIRRIHIESATAYQILGAVLLVLFGIWLGSRLFAGESGYESNIYAELLGIAATYFIFDNLNRRSDEVRRQREKRRELADGLLREARSPDPAIAQFAFQQMKELKLIYGEDSILRGTNLRGAKPGQVDLSNANLDGADLSKSDFSGSNFFNASLEAAILSNADLSEAEFFLARFMNANLVRANLSNSILVGSNQEGADLLGASLTGARFYIRPALLDGVTKKEDDFVLFRRPTLPDGSRWKSESDMDRFTDFSHPQFWSARNARNS